MISVSYQSKRIQKAAVRHPGPGVLRSRKRSMPFPAVGTARQNGILLQEPQDRMAFCFRNRKTELHFTSGIVDSALNS